MAFAVGFGLFVLSMVVVAAFAVRWGVGQDRRRRAAVQQAGGPATTPDASADQTDGGPGTADSARPD